MRLNTPLLTIAVASVIVCSCACKHNSIPVIPLPQEVEMHCGSFKAAGASVTISPSLDEMSSNYVSEFAELLATKSPANAKGGKFVFEVDETLAPEEYTLEVGRKTASVKASGLAGFVYAIQTIKQLLPAEIWGGEADPKADWTIKAMSVRDYPRFGYRGMHLDCSRHFFPLEEVYRYIDVMVAHKLNRLHWHLTDDQGWRIEIRKYPRITEVGAWRKGTMIGHDFSSNDNIPYGGFYTQDELKAVVAYAAERGITIVPEIDLPGHMQAVVAAYPELGCTGGPYDVWTIWGVSEDVLCAGNEKSFKMLEDILTEVMDIFPSEYIHIGGDECPKTRWAKCPKCQAKIKALGIKADEHFKAEDYLQSYVMTRVEDFLAAHGRRIIGWDEILEGKISQNATIMSWRGAAGGIKAAQSGRDAIMTPNGYMYFDYCQSHDIENEPLCFGGYVPVSRVYEYEPFDDQMTEDEFTHILGVQANLWTEYITTCEQLEYMLVPRIAALSEVQWCKPENKDFDRFRASLENVHKVYDAMGITYATHVFDGRLDEELAPKDLLEHKGRDREATLLSTPHLNYRFHAPVEFFDGKTGDKTFSCGAWIGHEGEPLAVVVKMGKTDFQTVTINSLVDKGGYVFAPTWIKLSTSADGENFVEAGSVEFPCEGPEDPDGIKQFTISLKEPVRSEYLKVECGTVEHLPAWHSAGTAPLAFLFVDEIIIN